MIKTAAQAAFNAVSTVAGGAAGAIAGGVVGIAKGLAKGSGLVETPTAQSVLKAAEDTKNAIPTSTIKPETNNNTQIPRGAKLPEGSMASVGLKQGDEGVAQAGSVMDNSLAQMERMQVINMNVQTQTALMKAIASAYEGVTKVIGKSGDAIKSNAG